MLAKFHLIKINPANATKSKTYRQQLSIAMPAILIICVSTFNNASADIDLYRCKSTSGTSYQDQPCTGVMKKASARTQQHELTISTKNTGVTNSSKGASASSVRSDGRYYSSPIKLPNTFQDTDVPAAVDIKQLRKELQDANRALQCQNLRKELWQLEYSASNHADTQKKDLRTTKQNNPLDKIASAEIHEHSWQERRRAALLKRIDVQCDS